MMHAPLKHGLKVAAVTLLRRHATLRERLLRAAASRGHVLVLCYHRIAPASSKLEVVDPVPPERFAEQLRALKSIGDIVPMARALSFAESYERPAFTVTFDDDDPCHVKYALPVLREMGIPATFFLSGRALHGLRPYWWTLMEQSVEEVGIDATCQLLGRPGRNVKDLARACRRAKAVPELPTRSTPPSMAADDIRALADAGMTIGFHTLRHPAMSLLSDAELEGALTEGRDALAAAAGAAIDLLAYPFGCADARVAHATRRAGFTAAFATEGRPLQRDSDPFLIGRWQPGLRSAEQLMADAALHLGRSRLQSTSPIRTVSPNVARK